MFKLFCIIFFPLILSAQSLLINEVMSVNTDFLADEDGDYCDWIELYNAGSESVSLQDWSLSDLGSDLRKWLFPDIIVPERSHLLIFASNKNRLTAISHWETVINQGDVWRYRTGSSDIPFNWNRPDYNDGHWPQGATGIGYGDGDDATIVSPVISVFARRTFILNEPAAVLGMVLHVDYDDAFVAYLNGVEIARANIGQAGDRPAWNQAANGDHEANMYRGGAPDRFDLNAFRPLLFAGVNLLAIQVHNQSASSSDLTLIPFLSLGMEELPSGGRGSPAILGLVPSHLHTNFAVSGSGESLFLTTAAGDLADSVTVPASVGNISYGRLGDGGERWAFLPAPTPGAGNPDQGMSAIAEAVTFSAPAGFHASPVMLDLTCATAGADIRFSTDGSTPNSGSPRFVGSLLLTQSMVVRARAFAPGHLPGPIVSKSYLFTSPAKLPVISITIDPVDLWDTDTGIYVLGKSHEPQSPYFGANFWQDWERPAHVEFFENSGAFAFNQDAGVKIFGGWSRARPQKSMSFFARNRYGKDRFEYPLFPDLPFTSYRSFILRNAANDWDRTFIVDGLIHTLLWDVDLEKQAYRPCVVYLNGEYWGILNMREKISEHYLAQHHPVNADSIDRLEMDGRVIEGNNEHYRSLIDYITGHNLALQADYDYVKTRMDVENFITYQAAQIYVDNRDWPGNNIKYWRPQTEDGRWRWILYDTEWGFGINAYGAGGNRNAYDYNTLAYATSPTQTARHHGNPPWSTLLLRSLLQNGAFKHAFINRFADLMNTVFNEQRVSSHIDSLQLLLQDEMQRHYDKWRRPVWWVPQQLWWSSFNEWHNYIKIVRDFGRYRNAYMRQHLINKFGLKGVHTLQLRCEPAGAGVIRMNDFFDITVSPWSGIYFSDVPIRLAAKPNPGYRFMRWQGDTINADPAIEFKLTGPLELQAVFSPIGQEAGRIVVNEINYRSEADWDTEDWVELYNPGPQTVELQDWLIKDDDDAHFYRFDAGVALAAEGYLIVCRDTSKFRLHHPSPAIQLVGNLPFGLSSNGDQVRLFDTAGRLVDSVQYANTAPWPPEADGKGATLELIDPAADNSLPENWAASARHGTPGAKNSSYTHAAKSRSNSLPESVFLAQNFPNPFNTSTNISFIIPKTSTVYVKVYNLQGRCLRTLIGGRMAAGLHHVTWDGLNEVGVACPAGIYFYALENGATRLVRRMALVR